MIQARPWRIWDLDAELRYGPVAAALPVSPLPICEIGSGPAGLAAWTPREIIGIDPGPDEKHGEIEPPPNLTRVAGEGAAIPLGDRSCSAAVAVDMLEHVPTRERPAIVAEMKRVTAAGGRLIVMGPAGRPAAEGDRRLLERLRARGVYGGWTVWLDEHLEHGLPEVADLLEYVGRDRVERVTVRGVFNLRLWSAMHLVAMGALPRLDRAHRVVYRPLAELARRAHRLPCYRTLVIAEIS